MTDQQRLDQARDEYHKLLTGLKARVVVDRGGERVEFTAADKDALRRYIDELAATIAGTRVSGPLSVYC